MADVKPTKNERIAALEAEVAALRADLALLRRERDGWLYEPHRRPTPWWETPQWGWTPLKITCGFGSMGPADPLIVTVD